MFSPRDAPYPELKKTHTMAHVGRPFNDVKPPSAAPVWAAIEGLARYHVLVAALELDVFDTLDRLGPSPAQVVADTVDASIGHLRTLLDSVVVLGLLDRVDGVYELNDTARRYLLSDGPASMADLVPVAPGPPENWVRLADTVRTGRPATPIDDDPAAFYVPLVEGTFTTMFRCATRADLRLRYSALPSPRVLDLGAGGAPWAIAILVANPDATALVNDLPGVLPVAQRKAAEYGVDGRVEWLPGDYHDVALDDGGYDLVVLGHICRTEGERGTKRLLDRSMAALRPEGRLVLADYFCDHDRKLNPHAVLMGATMMASTVNGNAFTAGQYAEWIGAAGFESVRLIEPIGFQQQFVASKPRLPQGGQ